MEIFTVVQPTAAYIDPSTTTILISSISGIVIAIGAGAVIIWRKAKKKVANVLHIDENAGKEVEEELVIKEDETKN
jgi:uncharacterized protein YqgV (UPF0045/DUF77 family)